MISHFDIATPDGRQAVIASLPMICRIYHARHRFYAMVFAARADDAASSRDFAAADC